MLCPSNNKQQMYSTSLMYNHRKTRGNKYMNNAYDSNRCRRYDTGLDIAVRHVVPAPISDSSSCGILDSIPASNVCWMSRNLLPTASALCLYSKASIGTMKPDPYSEKPSPRIVRCPYWRRSNNMRQVKMDCMMC